MDREIVDRMRNENAEQFQTLVRMHLSFELDLNTDTVDNDGGVVGGAANGKLRSKRLFMFQKKSKQLQNATTAKGPPFNIANTLTSVGIEQIKQMIVFLMRSENIIQEGIFRRTGSVARQNELRRRLHDQAVLDFSDGAYTVHDCASVLKAIIADLPEPLLTDNFYVIHCQIAELYNSNHIEYNQTKETRLLHSIQLLLLLLPLENRSLFHDIINMLNETTKYESSNKMSSESLATLFTPHLICPRKLSPEALHNVSQNMSGLISFMIGRGDELQSVPQKLATDIRVYFAEQKRKKVLSPELQMLDESVTSDSTANTVFTFVDREKTAEAHISNPTDTALAQLYAYIQTLPESSKKRKLIKQFNKENGQGTPLQQQMMMRLKKGNSTSSQRSNKSISGSIKKHIFHSALGSKTPKRGTMAVSTPSIPAVSTPNIVRQIDAGGSTTHFQTPVRGASLKHGKSTSLAFETPKTTNIAKMFDKTSKMEPPEEENNATNQIKSERKEPTKIKFAEHEQHEQHEQQNYHTPISFKMNKFIMCFKSEPDLSRCQNVENETAPMLNRGRFIAKKLLSGVSMVNLRRPFANSNEKGTIAVAKTPIQTVNEDEQCERVAINVDQAQNQNQNENENGQNDQAQKHELDETDCNKLLDDAIQIDKNVNRNDDYDDEDFVDNEEDDREYDESVDKENESPQSKMMGAFSKKIKSNTTTTNCGVPLSDSIVNDSVSPITKSTHRMSKAMQESIMTPRSRKPVIIGALRDMATDNYHKKLIGFQMKDDIEDDDPDFDEEEIPDQINASLQRSKSENDLLLRSPAKLNEQLNVETTKSLMAKSTSDETLSTPFRQYLISRSLLMTTPVDSSFSSQSDDFENLNDSEMSESLIYCLNGNEPIDDCVGLPTWDMPTSASCSSSMTPHAVKGCFFDSNNGTCRKNNFTTKRPSTDDDLGSSSLNDQLLNAKKNHLELDETAL